MKEIWERLSGIQHQPPPPGEIPQAAVLVPLYEGDDGVNRLILTKRPMTMPTHAGHLAFPGGRPDDGDGGPVGTALREAEEEVGIDPAWVTVLGFLPAIHTVEYSLMVVPVVGWIEGVPELQPSPREVDKVLEPAVEIFTDVNRWRFETWREHKVWFFDLEGEVLWGATAHMVRQLVGLEPPVTRMPPGDLIDP
ncbi:MAG: CoA pyrophosphatase [Acidimicrobiia bacterium]|nr:CoA pyrophosphatase [Acidimicrobiia bacterium]MDH3396658.1 CoA pyrophosphatase [Acidimicrobiia bacterium]